MSHMEKHDQETALSTDRTVKKNSVIQVTAIGSRWVVEVVERERYSVGMR
jgi:hypothetical protein